MKTYEIMFYPSTEPDVIKFITDFQTLTLMNQTVVLIDRISMTADSSFAAFLPRRDATRMVLDISDQRVVSEKDICEFVAMLVQHELIVSYFTKHDFPKNIIGHAVLENQENGIYAHCHLNGTESCDN